MEAGREAGSRKPAIGGAKNGGPVKHILVVDDNDDVRDVNVETLREYRYRVSAAPGGSAIRDFLQTGDRVDCVILDALIPGEASLSLEHDLVKLKHSRHWPDNWSIRRG